MNDAWAQEWVTLQNQHEAYEGRGLLIKLLAVVLVAAGAWVPLSDPDGCGVGADFLGAGSHHENMAGPLGGAFAGG